MALPMATTTITVKRSADDGTVDRYDEQADPSTVASGVRAVIVAPRATTTLVKGERVVVHASFRADVCDIADGDLLTDDTTGLDYQVLDALQRYELGLTYCYGNLQIVKGAAP